MAIGQLYINEATALYESVLLRAPSGTTLFGDTVTVASTAEIDSWASVLQAGLVTIQQAITAFVDSPEAAANSDAIARLYEGLLGRAPDAGGFAYWVTELNSGAMSLQQIATAFVNSAEFQTDYGTNLNDTAFVTELYVSILGRNPDAGGLSYWVGQLGSSPSASTIAAVVLGFTQSAEYINDTQAGVNSFLTAAAQNALNGTTATAVGTASYGSTLSTSGTGHTFTLTTGIDSPGVGAFATQNIIGDNNLIQGTYDGATTTTFSPGDDIVGPAGSSGNTLSLFDAGIVAGAPFTAAATVSGVQIVDVTSGNAVGANTVTSTEGFTGLQNLNVTAAGGSAAEAAGTVSISLTDNAQGAAIDFVGGGLNATVTDSGAGTVGLGGVINVGQNAAAVAGVAFSNVAPLGLINVTENASTAGGAITGDIINVTGGTADTITANLVGATGAGNTVTGQGITVTGTSTTTTVSVIQSAAAPPANATTATPAVTATVAAVAASPGINAIAAATQAKGVATKAAVAGVVDGAVSVTDANAGSATAANTITSVTLIDYGTGSVIKTNALANLSLTDNTKGATLTITTEGAGVGSQTVALAANGVGASSGAAVITDTNNEIKTLNVTVASGNDYVNLVDTGLTTLTVAGAAETFNLTAINSAVLATVTISGAASFNAGGTLVGDAALTTGFTTTSSGTITAALNDLTQTFTGSTGQDIITITADATQKITGGSATNNELVLNNTAATFNATTAHLTNTNVTGFEILGLGAAAAGNYNMSTLNSSFTSLDITNAYYAANDTATVTNAAQGSPISLDGANNGGAASTATVAVAYVDTSGATDAVTVTIGSASTLGDGTGPGASVGAGAGFTTASLTLTDANLVGIGNLTFVSNGTDVGNLGGAMNTITALVDDDLSGLTVTGAAGLTIGAITGEAATTLTIAANDTSVNGVTITTLTDSLLGTITFTGSNSTTIGNLVVTGGTITNLTLNNTGTGSVSIDTASNFVDNALSVLILKGSIAVNQDVIGPATATFATTGVTISASTDNSHLNLDLTGAAAATQTDTITVGNGNDNITDASSTGTVNVTVGTGSNQITLGAANDTTAVYNVTLGTHTLTSGPDFIDVGSAGNNFATAPNLVVTGAVAGDEIFFLNDVASSNAGTLTATAAGASVAATITEIEEAAGGAAHTVAYAVFGGNTYVAEDLAAGAASATNTTLIELVGTHTLSAATGHVLLLS